VLWVLAVSAATSRTSEWQPRHSEVQESIPAAAAPEPISVMPVVVENQVHVPIVPADPMVMPIDESLAVPEATEFAEVVRRQFSASAWRVDVKPSSSVPRDPVARTVVPEGVERPQEEPASVPMPPMESRPDSPQPLPGHNPPPSYPLAARRRGIQGTVLVQIEVSEDGSVVACQVLESSGAALLDGAAIAAARKWRFAWGPGVVEVPFVFVLGADAKMRSIR